MAKLNIVLVEPEIPQNTGNIARTCDVTGAALHLVKPLGFTIDDRKLKRAGLDYWWDLEIHYYENLADFMLQHGNENLWYYTTKADAVHTDAHVDENGEIYMLFGKETKGLPEDFLCEHPERCVRIPMRSEKRSLNLSNSVAIAVYEILRQDGFETLKTDGERIQKLLSGKK